MTALDGFSGNSPLLTIFNDLHGKEVLVETVDANQFMGVFAACSVQDSVMQIGLKYAYKRSKENSDNLLPKKNETEQKMIFNFNEIVSLTSLLNEEKLIKGFATDRDYHGNKSATNGCTGDEDLQMWECDDEGEEIEAPNNQHMPDQRQRYARNGGWSVDEMFNANTELGVQSTFDDDLSQYTTAEVKGSEADRRRAERIAREIEGNAQSRMYSRLENDDDERDLDKETTEDDFEEQTKKGQRGAYSLAAKNGRGGGAAATNRRAEAMKGGNDRGRANGPPSRYGQGGPGQNYGQQRGGGQYNPGQGKRPTGAEVQEQFNEWTMKESGNRKEGSGKVFENSNFKASKVLLEPAARPANNRTATDKGSQQGAAVRRADDLRQWSQGFDLKGNKAEVNSEKESTPSESPVRVSAPTGNAWNKGPPTSLVSVGANNSAVPANSNSPVAGVTPPAEAQEVVEPAPGPSAEIHEKDANETDPAVKDSGNDTLSTEDVSATSDSKEDSSSALKKFSFNPNAPVFTPRQAPTTPTPQMTPQPQQMQQMTAVSLGPIPSNVSVQSSMPPPGVMQGMPGQQLVWQQGSVPQGYAQMTAPGQYTPYMMGAGGQPIPVAPISMAPPRNGVAAGQQAYVQSNPRRSTGAPQNASTVLVAQNPNQWQNQMVMQTAGGMVQVPYNYGQYPMQSGSVPPQQYAGAPQMMQSVPQQQPQQQQQQQPVFQQRFPPMTNFVVPQQQQQQPPQSSMGGQQQRYPTPQQSHQGHDGSPYQQGGNQGSASAGPGSQPPTPGPQPPQPVASPAQPRGGSPASMSGPPPQPTQQQFMHAQAGAPQQQMPPPSMTLQQQQQHQAMMSQQQHPQQFYAPPQYLYQPGVMMYNPHAPPMGAVHVSGSGASASHLEHGSHQMDGGMIQTTPVPQPQYVASDMHGNYVHAAGVPAAYYQGYPHPQAMSRQNSLPQAYVPQGAPPGMNQQPPNGPQGGSGGPGQQPQQSSIPPQQQ